LWALAAGLLLVPALAGCDPGGSGTGARAPDEQHSLVGAPAPDFSLKAQSGGVRASPGDHRGQVVIVDFWATWCDPCRDSFPVYQRLVSRFRGDLAILGVSVDEDPDGIAAFAQQTGVKFPLAWDEGQVVARQYGPDKMPTSFMLDRNGIVRYVHSGFRSGDEDDIEAEVQALLE
jgi:peroxiredoxin